MNCAECSNQVICEAQNKVDLSKMNDINDSLKTMTYLNWENAKDLVNEYRKMLIRRNERITGRC